jgi:glycolate oxidase iron-sulfur subunit
MKHSVPIDVLGLHGAPMADAIGSCVHCGFCLPTCPTYVTMGEEMDSPRGRILLMKEVLEGELELETALPFIDNCLGCQACETACPSGVAYGELLTPFRAYAEDRRRRPVLERVRRALLLRTLPYPRRVRLAARMGIVARPVSRMLPRSLRAPLALLPQTLSASRPLPERFPAQGPRRGRVALLAGCAQQVFDQEINWATLRVLAANGIETVIPRGQGCCGALSLHAGAMDHAVRLARRNLAVFADDFDAILTNAAGCGSAMHEYGMLFAGQPDHEAGVRLAERTVDVSVFLNELGLRGTPGLARPVTVAYHDACHLAHAQGIRAEPRALLGAIANLDLVEPAEPEICCGSAGLYNLEQPERAAELGARKLANLRATGASMIATGNIGCITQLRSNMGHPTLPVMHTIELLDAAYRCSPTTDC